MRVGLVLEQCLAPVPGGTGRYSREVAARSRTSRADREDPVVAGATAWHRELLRIPGVPSFRLAIPRRPLIALWERGLGPAIGGDVVHALTPLAPPRRRTPLVVTVHDAVPWTHPETLTPRGVRWHRSAIERAARTADLVVVPTMAVAEELRAHVSLGDRVRVIGEGVSADLRLPDDADKRAQELRLPDGYLLTVATLEPRKGLSVLLEQLARPEAPDLPLLVAGQPGWGGVDPPAEARSARDRPGARARPGAGRRPGCAHGACDRPRRAQPRRGVRAADAGGDEPRVPRSSPPPRRPWSRSPADAEGARRCPPVARPRRRDGRSRRPRRRRALRRRPHRRPRRDRRRPRRSPASAPTPSATAGWRPTPR